MRVKIQFLINDNFTFQNSLNEAMTAFIYRCIEVTDKAYSKQLHDNGYSKTGYKKFTYHTYSFIQSNRIVKNELIQGTATVIFSSVIEETIIKLVQGLVKIGKVQLFSHSFNIISIEYIKEPNVSDGLFKIISPIFMMDCNHKWLSPGYIEEKLVSNLIEKYYALYKTLPRNMNLNIRFLNYSAEYVKYKSNTYKGYVGIIALQGSKELIETAYRSGLGSKNGIGMGLIEKI